MTAKQKRRIVDQKLKLMNGIGRKQTTLTDDFVLTRKQNYPELIYN